MKKKRNLIFFVLFYSSFIIFKGVNMHAKLRLAAVTWQTKESKYKKKSLLLQTQTNKPMPVNTKIENIEYLPYGECFFERRDIWNTPYKFNAKELDQETGLYYYGARYYTPEVSIWLSVDPLADKFYNTSPYMYCVGNPIKLIDYNGMDTAVFGSDNKFIEIKPGGDHVGQKLGDNGFYFNFTDPENDIESIRKGEINKLYIAEDKKILNDLDRADVNKKENKGFIDGPLYLKNHSNATTNEGELDFLIKSEIIGENVGLPGNYLYITKVNGMMIAHNNYNFGNFMWGASANSLNVDLSLALLGAHLNNYFNDERNVGKAWYQRDFDSKDDQLSISLGWNWRRNLKK